MRIYLLISAAIICFALNSCKPSSDKAQNYYSEILQQLDLIVEKESIMINFINMEMQKADTNTVKKSKVKINDTTNLALEIDASFLDFKKQIDNSLSEIQKLPDFDKKTALRDAAIELCKEYQSVAASEYIEVIKIVKIPLSLYTEEDDNKFLEITEQIDNKLQVKIDSYVKILKAFSSDYRFELIGDSTNNNIK
jgi:hypothetical protein